MYLCSFGIQQLIKMFDAYTKYNLLFGGSVTDAHKEQYAKSKQWKKDRFRNLSRTKIDINPRNLPGLIKGQLINTKVRTPQKPIEVQRFDREIFEQHKNTPKFTWFGHSVLLLQIDGKNFLIDPMFGSDASPIAPISTKRFSENTLDLIDELPHIEAIFFTHDHYDHLDYASIEKLKDKVDKYYTGIGLGRHLECWGVATEKITELDWWDHIQFDTIKITFVPSRHSSGRGLFDRDKVLWGGWVFQAPHHQIYWSGDGGYDNHFKEIGKKFGAFDWAFMECGQYNKRWHQMHMYPEESIQASIEVNAKIRIPIHWGGFALALHPWKESVECFVQAAKEQNTPICTPKIGETIVFGKEPKPQAWYQLLD